MGGDTLVPGGITPLSAVTAAKKADVLQTIHEAPACSK